MLHAYYRHRSHDKLNHSLSFSIDSLTRMEPPPSYEFSEAHGKPPSYLHGDPTTSIIDPDGQTINIPTVLPGSIPTVSARLPSYSQLVAVPLPLTEEEIQLQKRLRFRKRAKRIGYYTLIALMLFGIALFFTIRT
ncbi:hypothetical protein PRIPAC_91002 [Pristionchus pacificus]|uniref:Uncharacterized protein n=1 Tax=Pristionchus pacificus TaxID=54126 RepID=A0A2A6B608_PRIPA|nr:hypothetical protein PRIPAC_91002 [Pristionchus pacificus]|eukprot:PDM61314.1 hypothetical protein PRIPAC_50756 [Pristionchus pacificus]